MAGTPPRFSVRLINDLSHGRTMPTACASGRILRSLWMVTSAESADNCISACPVTSQHFWPARSSRPSLTHFSEAVPGVELIRTRCVSSEVAFFRTSGDQRGENQGNYHNPTRQRGICGDTDKKATAQSLTDVSGCESPLNQHVVTGLERLSNRSLPSLQVIDQFY